MIQRMIQRYKEQAKDMLIMAAYFIVFYLMICFTAFFTD